MSAFKLPGIDFTKMQGSIDDGEHAGGRVLLKLLLREQAFNKAVFVVRYFGGKHIGPQRFNIIERVAESSLKELINHEARMRKPPTQEELDKYRRDHPEPDHQHHNPWAATDDEASQPEEEYEEANSQNDSD